MYNACHIINDWWLFLVYDTKNERIIVRMR